MSKIHLIKFSFGTNVHLNIPLVQLKYFAVFFSEYFNVKYDIDENQAEKLKTIPISITRISNNSDILARKLVESLKNELGLIDSANNFINKDDLIVIDIKSSLRDLSYVYLSSQLDNLLKTDTLNDKPRFVIILEDIPALIQNYISILQYIKDGKVLLIDKKKRFYTRDFPVKVNKDFSFELISKPSLDRTKFKLIRKIGHYGRYNDKAKNDLNACNQYFYDGRDCVVDVCDVLFEKVTSLIEKDSFNTSKIIFDSPESPWLLESILLLNSDLKTLKDDYSLQYTGYNKIDEITQISLEQENILFIVDLIHTGTVFTKCYNTLRKKFPNSNIKCVSILISDTQNIYINILKDKTTAEVEVNLDEKILVDFFLTVNQKRFDRANPCIMCNELHMDIIKDSSYINEGVLTTFEVWTMCDEAGYGKEDFITERESPYPNQVPLLPKRLDLIKDNSAYLALKYKKHIERHNFESTDLILVFPDERTSKKELKRRRKPIALEDTASGYFAETLMQLKEIEYFGIPRNILDKIKFKSNEAPDLTFIQEEYKDFYSRLRLLSDEIIIMDEFGLSGTTLRKIVAVLDIVKKKPKAYFPIFNFNPSVINNEKITSCKVLSLYDFNLKIN